MTESKKKFSLERGGGEGGEGGNCGSDASIRFSWVMVHRLQEANYSLHCSSALKSKIETARNTERKKSALRAIQLTGVRERENKTLHSKSLGGGGGGG